jgi:hypothetical protein
MEGCRVWRLVGEAVVRESRKGVRREGRCILAAVRR